jgi:hypothetical protein
MPAQRRRKQFHRRSGKIGCGARPPGLPGRKNAGDEQAETSQEIKGFLGWLEGYLGAELEDLSPKTNLQNYYEHDYDGFLAVLKKNGKKLAIKPALRKPGEDIKAEFEGSMGKLGPLREQIRQTDELIDAVVYRLYGLTEEEIGIAEGNENGNT